MIADVILEKKIKNYQSWEFFVKNISKILRIFCIYFLIVLK